MSDLPHLTSRAMSLPCPTPHPYRGAVRHCKSPHLPHPAAPWGAALRQTHISDPKDTAMIDRSMPSSIINLLANGRRSFDPNRHPGRYIHRPEDRGVRNGLTWSEALDLVQDRVVINDWIGTGPAVALLEHEQHAVVGFCLEVQAAWNRCREKLGLDAELSSHIHPTLKPTR